ncbi:outer membrane lipoprotein carrier protein LolA [Endozoicomonas sp. Mp262]|uniref:outer membrane lipoprotein carrier protein LolA n=1 Tax=Endozoicomonas sp. Mp262 TaxID=2919499 RepID=UPI0021DAFF37
MRLISAKQLCIVGTLLLALGAGASTAYSLQGKKPQEEEILQHDVCGILSAFKSVEVMQGHFQQEKNLPVFSRPLKSSGFFISVRNRGVLWEVNEPVSSKMVLMPGVLKQYTDHGVQELKATGTAYDGMGVLLPALFKGDMELLSRYFFVTSDRTIKGWVIQLKPINEKLAELIKSVVISGEGNHINQASLYGAAGDTTHITFEDIEISHRPATVEQLSWFM